MSGIVRFFVEMLSPDKRTTGNKEPFVDLEGSKTNMDTNGEEEEKDKRREDESRPQNVEYQVSISAVVTPSPPACLPLPPGDASVYRPSVASAIPSAEDSSGGEANEDKGEVISGSKTLEHTTRQLNYEEYRAYSYKVLTDYVTRRYFLQRTETESDDEDGEHDNGDASWSVPSPGRDPEPESQSRWIRTMTRSRSSKPKTPKIPLVTNTQHIVNSVSQIDMYTKLLHLNLCRVEKSWALRLSRRAETACHAVTRLTCDPKSLLPLSKFGRYEDDGPLFRVYKRVLSLELAQLDAPHNVQLHRTASNVDPEGKLYRRVRVYLYNRYAILANEFLTSHGNCTFYCRLANVPAACIFPYQQSQEAGWFDDDVSDYVVCIGDKSQCRNEAAKDAPLFFEHDDLQLRLLAVPDDPKKPSEEWIVDPIKAYQPKDLVLLDALQSWNEVQERSVPQQGVTDSIAPSSVQTPLSAPKDGGVVVAAPAGGAVGQARRLSESERPTKRAKVGMTCSNNAGYDALVDLQNILIRHLSLRNSKSPRFPSATVLGVVIGFSLPTRVKTGQWMITISIVDPTLPIDESGEGLHVVNCNIFRRKVEDLPTVRRAGDLVRMEEAGLQEYRGDMQLLGRTSTKITVFSWDQSSSKLMVQCVAAGMWIAADEDEYLQTLWDWGQERIATKPTLKRMQRIKLSEVATMDEPGDCTAMVCGLFETQRLSDSPIPRGFLRLWDGTGPPSSDPLPSQGPAALAMIANGDPPSEALVALHSTIGTLNNSPYRTETTRVLSEVVSVCGRVVNVAVWESHHWDFVKRNMRVGDFIRQRNVDRGTLANGLICLMAKAKSCLVPLPIETLEVRCLLVDHQVRMERNDPQNPSSGLLPISLPCSTEIAIREPPAVGREPETARGDAEVHEVPFNADDTFDTLSCCDSGQGQYLCRFSITQILPDCNDELVRLCSVRNGTPSFRFAVNLKDSTDELVAVVVGTVGDALFGTSAVEACRDESSSSSRNRGRRLLSRVCEPGLFWSGVVETRVIDGESYFFLKSAERMR